MEERERVRVRKRGGGEVEKDIDASLKSRYIFRCKVMVKRCKNFSKS